jgi:hypothetical protein
LPDRGFTQADKPDHGECQSRGENQRTPHHFSLAVIAAGEQPGTETDLCAGGYFRDDGAGDGKCNGDF